MPRWLLFIVTIAGFTAVVPLWVLALSAGDWRRALVAWWFFVRMLAALALPGTLAWLWVSFMA